MGIIMSHINLAMEQHYIELIQMPPEDSPFAIFNNWTSGDVYYELALFSEKGERVYSIFKTIWYPDLFDQWLTKNKDAIRNEEYPWPIADGLSILQATQQFYNREDDTTDEESDQIYNYRLRHEFWFAVRGCRLPDVCLGKHNGSYELSCRYGDEFVKYSVLLDRLFKRSLAR